MPDRRSPTLGLVALGLAPLVAGTAVGIATNAGGIPWYRRLAKPSWTPPDALFGPVWTLLYLLMGVALVLVVRERGGRAPASEASSTPAPEPTPTAVPAPYEAPAPSRTRFALGAFGVQLALNLLWSVLFFGARRIRLAAAELVVLWTAIATTIVAFGRIRPVAGALLVPYLAWTTFAGALNVAVARRNPGR